MIILRSAHKVYCRFHGGYMIISYYTAPTAAFMGVDMIITYNHSAHILL
jgi:hypothetical protein